MKQPQKHAAKETTQIKHSRAYKHTISKSTNNKPRMGKPNPIPRPVLDVDYVTPSAPLPFGQAKLVLLEDNDAVVKMIIKLHLV